MSLGAMGQAVGITEAEADEGRGASGYEGRRAGAGLPQVRRDGGRRCICDGHWELLSVPV